MAAHRPRDTLADLAAASRPGLAEIASALGLWLGTGL
jgi:hypothetical protein